MLLLLCIIFIINNIVSETIGKLAKRTPSYLLPDPVGSHSRRACDFTPHRGPWFFFPATALRKPPQILKASTQRSTSVLCIHMHGLEAASCMFCWESRSPGSQFQACPSNSHMGDDKNWVPHTPWGLELKRETSVQIPAIFLQALMPLRVKEAGKVGCAVGFPISFQGRKTCICSSAFSRLINLEQVSEVWRPGLPTGCLQADRTGPDVSLS